MAVCVCEGGREREGEIVGVREREEGRERERLCVYVRERECVCVCVCVFYARLCPWKLGDHFGRPDKQREQHKTFSIGLNH